MEKARRTSPNSMPAYVKPLLAQKPAQTFAVMFGEVVDAPVRARPFVPSAMQPRSPQPGVSGAAASAKPGVTRPLHDAAVEKSVRTGLQPGSAGMGAL